MKAIKPHVLVCLRPCVDKMAFSSMFRTSIAVSRQDFQKLNYRLFENN